ncbi:hypothetical protein MLGJGCBP_00467 [Rhodococcus sp. T7]|nr:hypothetical protein MLGJGCBP_00467 [Rhodococcus sp. T7]
MTSEGKLVQITVVGTSSRLLSASSTVSLAGPAGIGTARSRNVSSMSSSSPSRLLPSASSSDQDGNGISTTAGSRSSRSAVPLCNGPEST